MADFLLRARIDNFIDRLAAVRRLSARTCDAYRRDLLFLARQVDNIDPDKIDKQAIDRALAADFRGGRHPATLARRLSAWRAFFDFLIEQGGARSNPARLAKAPKKPARLPKALSPDEAARLLGAIEKRGDGDNQEAARFLRARDRALAELLYSSAARIGEAVALDIDDCDLRGGMLFIRQGKRGRDRYAPIGGAAKTALADYLNCRRARAPTAKALFVGARGGRLSARAAQIRIAALARAAGGFGRVTPHVLRHSCASHFLQSSGDLRATQELLGHAALTSTEVYTHLDFQALAKVYDRAHPRADKPAPAKAESAAKKP